MVLDIAKFHRTVPILPAHKKWFVLRGPDSLFFEHNTPFSCSCSSGNAGMIGGAIEDIWTAEGVKPNNRYEDDFLAARFPSSISHSPSMGLITYTYPYDRAAALACVQRMKVPWHPVKWLDFNFRFLYIGFDWDMEASTVALPEAKRIKFQDRVRIFIDRFRGRKCTMNAVMKIHGSLCHITFVHQEGRSHLPAFTNFIASFKGNKYATRRPPSPVITELIWWFDTLSIPSVARPLVKHGPRLNKFLYVDASTSWGIGITANGLWDAWQCKPGWRSKTRHIGWLEGVALELLIYAIEERGLHDVHLLVHSDNKGIIGAFDKGRSRNFDINLSIRRSAYVLASLNVSLDLTYIESKKNPADPLSRGEFWPASQRLYSKFTLPKVLSDHLTHVPSS
jgi:hypothetical protein